jgi:hypothetical protein
MSFLPAFEKQHPTSDPLQQMEQCAVTRAVLKTALPLLAYTCIASIGAFPSGLIPSAFTLRLSHG